MFVDMMFPEVYKHNSHKFDIIYNSPKCLHCYVDDLFAMIKKEVDDVNKGVLNTKLSIYSCHDTSILRNSLVFFCYSYSYAKCTNSLLAF